MCVYVCVGSAGVRKSYGIQERLISAKFFRLSEYNPDVKIIWPIFPFNF